MVSGPPERRPVGVDYIAAKTGFSESTIHNKTVRVGESGRELENPDKEFILRYYLTHQDDPSIQTMIEEYYEQFN